MQLSLLENGVTCCALQTLHGIAYKIPFGHVVPFLKSQAKLIETGGYYPEFCVNKACNYVFFGTNNDGQHIAYIGESRFIGNRFQNHHQTQISKDDNGLVRNWDHVVIFCRADNHFNEGHVLYIERQLLLLAIQNSKYLVTNGKERAESLAKQNISSVDKDISDDFVNNIKILTKSLGYDIFEPDGVLISHYEQPESTTPLFYLDRKNVEAIGQPLENGKFVVLKKSRIADTELPSCRTSTKANRELLKSNGYIGKGWVLTKDCLFTSPSAAASVVCGGETNGLSNWRTSVNDELISLSQWYVMQTEQVGLPQKLN
jgi:hypothetical protein